MAKTLSALDLLKGLARAALEDSGWNAHAARQALVAKILADQAVRERLQYHAMNLAVTKAITQVEVDQRTRERERLGKALTSVERLAVANDRRIPSPVSDRPTSLTLGGALHNGGTIGQAMKSDVLEERVWEMRRAVAHAQRSQWLKAIADELRDGQCVVDIFDNQGLEALWNDLRQQPRETPAIQQGG